MSSSGSDSEISLPVRLQGDSESKLENSINSYGSNSYYYAHSKSKEFFVPEHATVVSGPGIITGGTPVKIATGEPVLVSGRVRRKIEKYSWCDEGDKVRIYVDDSNVIPHILESDERVTCEFADRSVCLDVEGTEKAFLSLEIPELCEEIDPALSSFKVSLGKRISITLKKKGSSKWDSLKKK